MNYNITGLEKENLTDGLNMLQTECLIRQSKNSYNLDFSCMQEMGLLEIENTFKTIALIIFLSPIIINFMCFFISRFIYPQIVDKRLLTYLTYFFDSTEYIYSTIMIILGGLLIWMVYF